MTTLTASGIRTTLTNRLAVLAARVPLSTDQLNEAAQAGFRALYPHLYKRTRVAGLSHSSGELTVADVTQLYRLSTVIDEVIYEVPFLPIDETTVEVDSEIEDTISAYYYVPYEWHASNNISFPDSWIEALYLACEVEALEIVAADRVKYRGQRPNHESDVDENEILNLVGTKRDRLNQLLDEKAMSLPGTAVY